MPRHIEPRGSSAARGDCAAITSPVRPGVLARKIISLSDRADRERARARQTPVKTTDAARGMLGRRKNHQVALQTLVDVLQYIYRNNNIRRADTVDN